MYNQGYVPDASKIYTSVLNNYTNGVTVGLSNYTKGKKEWNKFYGYPEVGFLFHYEDLKNHEKLGSLFASARFINFNLFNFYELDANLRTFFGLAYASKIFDPVENYKNPFFSKHINFFFGVDLNIEYPVSKHNNLYAFTGFSLFHVSNGESRIPNKGMNNVNFNIGLSYRSIGKPEPDTKVKIRNRKIYFTVLPTIGIKEDWRYGSDKFTQLSISSEFLYQTGFKSIIGIGIDYFYDETLKSYSNHNLEPVKNNTDATYGGMCLTYQLNLYPLILVFKSGPQIINAKDSFGTLYNLYGFKYFFTPRLFALMFHRSHGPLYGDNIEFGIGYSFKKSIE